MEKHERAFDFFLGAMVGVFGNLFVSTIIEIGESVFGNLSSTIVSYWALMFTMSSIFFFQFTKYAVKKYLTTQESLWSFDWASFSCLVLGIFVIIWALLFRG